MELEPPVERLHAALVRRGVRASAGQCAQAMRAEIGFYRAHLHTARDAQSLRALRERCAIELAAHLPPVSDPLEVLMEAIAFSAYEEVPEVLAALRQGGRRLIVVSNWDVSLHEVLETTGLTPLLDGAISSAEAGCAKPDPAIFRAALELAGVTAAEALHVGDTPEEDLDGARAAGIAAVLVDRGAGETLRKLL